MKEESSQKFVTIGDILSGDFSRMPESAYRRGYTQGYFSALDDMKRGANLERLFDFLHTALHKWRALDSSERVNPPYYERKVNKNDKPI